MGTQFRKTKKIAPGINATISSKGGSMSFGGKGYRKTYGSRGVTTTYRIPGTGISLRETKSWETIAREKEKKRARREIQSKKETLAFKESPLQMILSCCCMAMIPLTIVIPQLSFWWIIPSFILGIIFYLWGVDSAERKVQELESEE